ncbi:MAG: hypothetical protein HOO88_05865 [Kiritimatiellaceae bacterium]|nr:hypothetical protein [Kiritimatiellaceae bacterium]
MKKAAQVLLCFWLTQAEAQIPLGNSPIEAEHVAGYHLTLLCDGATECAGLSNSDTGRSLLLAPGISKEGVMLVSVSPSAGTAIVEQGGQCYRLALSTKTPQAEQPALVESLSLRQALIVRLIDLRADPEWIKKEIEDYQVEAVREGQPQLPFSSAGVDQRLHAEGLLPASSGNYLF